MLTRFRMPASDYRRFMNFLSAHGCGVAVREFREAASSQQTPPENLPVYPGPADAPVDLAS